MTNRELQEALSKMDPEGQAGMVIHVGGQWQYITMDNLHRVDDTHILVGLKPESIESFRNASHWLPYPDIH